MGNAQAKKAKQEKLKKQKQAKELQELQQRQKLIGTAVLFLQGDKIQSVPQLQKKIFLRKKGLSDDMIEEAYKRLKQKQNKEKDIKTLNLQQKPKQQSQKKDK